MQNIFLSSLLCVTCFSLETKFGGARKEKTLERLRDKRIYFPWFCQKHLADAKVTQCRLNKHVITQNVKSMCFSASVYICVK